MRDRSNDLVIARINHVSVFLRSGDKGIVDTLG